MLAAQATRPRNVGRRAQRLRDQVAGLPVVGRVPVLSLMFDLEERGAPPRCHA
jgi:hypothetical protein